MPAEMATFRRAIKFSAENFLSLNFGEMEPDVFKLFCPSERDFTHLAQENWLN